MIKYSFSKSFANLDGLRRYLDTAETNKTIFPEEHSKTGKKSFTGTYSFEEADALLRDGDTKNAERLKAVSGTGLKAPAGETTKTRRYNHVTGGNVNVPAMLNGLPKSMIAQKKMIYKNTKVLSLIYGFSIDWTVNEDEISRVSVNLVSAIMGLEKKGYRINLYVGFGCQHSEERVGMFVRIKDAGQYIDPKKMAYPLVNPSMLRRHNFRFLETVPGLKVKTWSHGYGRPLKDIESLTDLAKEAGLTPKKVVTFYDIRNKTAPEIMKLLLD